MNADRPERDSTSLAVLPSYEERVALTVKRKADFVASPLAMGELFNWEEDDETEM